MTSLFVVYRMYPQSWHNTIAVRWEIYGCVPMVVDTTVTVADVDVTTETSEDAEESDEDAAPTTAANVMLLLLCASMAWP